MSFVDSIVAQALSLETALFHAYARMEANTDEEALHDLRINLRRLRSLLRPLRAFDGVALLDAAATQLGTLTTPVRDLEVLAAELVRQGLRQQANARQAIARSSYAAIVESSTLNQFFARLDAWPSDFREAERLGQLRRIKQRVAKRLLKQVVQLNAALADPHHDRHELRLLTKRARYATDAYPQLSPISVETSASLKRVQSALGDWHDHFQWCLKSQQENDLMPLQQHWQVAAEAALRNAEVELLQLSELLGNDVQA